MVTFLVSLVVVGGASILILRVTLEDSIKPATDDDGSHGAVAPGAMAVVARRASAFLVPIDRDDLTHARRARPDASSLPDAERRTAAFLIPDGAPSAQTPAAPIAPPAPAPAGDPDGLAPPGPGAAPVRATAASAPVDTDVVSSSTPAPAETVADVAMGPDDDLVLAAPATVAATAVGSGELSERVAPLAQLSWPQVDDPARDRAPEISSPGPDDPTMELDLDRTGQLDLDGRGLQQGARRGGAQDQLFTRRGGGPDRTVAAPAALADGARTPVPARPARPPFRRRLLGRVLGAVKLVLLLVVTGFLLAAVLGTAVVLVMVGVRAAIGS